MGINNTYRKEGKIWCGDLNYKKSGSMIALIMNGRFIIKFISYFVSAYCYVYGPIPLSRCNHLKIISIEDLIAYRIKNVIRLISKKYMFIQLI